MLCLQMYDNYEVFRLSNFKILGNTHNHIHVQTHLELKLQFVLIAFLSSFKRSGILNGKGLKQLHRIQNNGEIKVSLIIF